MDIQTALLVILTLCIVINAGVLAVLILLMRKWKQLIKIYKNRREGGTEKMIDPELFNRLPKDYQDAVNHIVAEVLGDDWPDMNDAFREWQGEIVLAGALEEDRKPDLKLFEIEALAFRGGWERREQASGVPS